MSDRPLPANVDAERMVLGSALLGAEFGELCRDLTAADFSLGHHGTIFAAMCGLHEHEMPITHTTLADELNRRKQLIGVGGLSYIAALDAGLPQLRSVAGYVAIVRRTALQRKIIRVSQKIADYAFDEDDPEQLVENAVDLLGKLRIANGHHGFASEVMDYGQLLAKETPAEKLLFDTFPVPTVGLTLMVGEPKAGKSVLATQIAASVVTNQPLFGFYKVQETGAVLIVERDDPKGPQALSKQLAMLVGTDPKIPIYTTGTSPDGFGPAMAEWLEGEITRRKLKLVVLDSYTAIRSARSGNSDVVKLERAELELLDGVSKRLQCAIVLLHHGSKTASGLDWTMSASGTFSMFAATETLCHVSRFQDSDGDPERLVRIRGRHSSDLYLALRYDKQLLSYLHVLDGGGASLLPFISQLQSEFGDNPFGPKDVTQATGMTRITVFRHLEKLCRADVLRKLGKGQYALAVKV